MNKLILKKIINEVNVNKEEELRVNLYAIYTDFLLSKEYFKRNIEIQPFITKCNLEFKEYVYASRTVLVSKMIRFIERSNHEELKKLFNIIKAEVFSELNLSKKKNKRKNDLDDVLNQFGD